MQNNYNCYPLITNTSHQQCKHDIILEKPKSIKLLQTETQPEEPMQFQHQLVETKISNQMLDDPPLMTKPSIEENLLKTGSSISIEQSFNSIPSLQNVDESMSPTKLQYYTCFYCQNKIIGLFLELPCLHIFHKQCLYEGVVKSQVSEAPVLLTCLCKESIPLVSLKVLYREYDADIILCQIYQNQLKALIKNIIEKNQIIIYKCKYCEFMFIYNDKLPSEQHYCPLCLMFTESKRLN